MGKPRWRCPERPHHGSGTSCRAVSNALQLHPSSSSSRPHPQSPAAPSVLPAGGGCPLSPLPMPNGWVIPSWLPSEPPSAACCSSTWRKCLSPPLQERRKIGVGVSSRWWEGRGGWGSVPCHGAEAHRSSRRVAGSPLGCGAAPVPLHHRSRRRVEEEEVTPPCRGSPHRSTRSPRASDLGEVTSSYPPNVEPWSPLSSILHLSRWISHLSLSCPTPSILS